jgi:hypothetical protein
VAIHTVDPLPRPVPCARMWECITLVRETDSPFVHSVTRGTSLTCVGPGCGRYLDANGITSIPTGSFTGLTALQEL